MKRRDKTITEDDLIEFRVLVRRPEGVPEVRLRYYIEEAVSGWKGQFIDDPLQDLYDVRVLRGKVIKKGK